MCLALNVKKFEFWRAHSGVTPHCKPLIFVWFSLFLISTHFKNLIHLRVLVAVQKFEISEGPIEGDFLTWHPDFSRALILPDIFSCQILNAVRLAV